MALGAFGAHALRARLDARSLELWGTAAQYLMYGALAVLAVGLAVRGGLTAASRAGWALGAGTALFSGTVAALALGGPRWLGALTPVGGTLMIAGFLLFAWAALR